MTSSDAPLELHPHRYAEHRIDEDEALDTAVDLVTGRPREVFKL